LGCGGVRPDYRLQPYREDARALDGKRAIQLVRSRAAEFKLDLNKVGYIGFSAGSNMGRSWWTLPGPAIPKRPIPSTAKFAPRLSGAGVRSGADYAWRKSEELPPTFLMCAAGDTGNASAPPRRLSI